MNKPLVLVVEDDTPVRNLITTTLKTHEYRYLSAQNGASAVMEALSHTNLGYFKTRNGETVKLFTHSDSCFIEIEDCRHNRFYLSRKRTEETSELYDAILSRLSGK